MENTILTATTEASLSPIAKTKQFEKHANKTNRLMESPAAAVNTQKITTTAIKSKAFSIDPTAIANWNVEDVVHWAESTEHCSDVLCMCLRYECIDGQVLLAITENDVHDMRYRLGYNLTFGEIKKFWLAVLKLQLKIKELSPPVVLGISGHITQAAAAAAAAFMPATQQTPCAYSPEVSSYINDSDTYYRVKKKTVPPEYFKTAMSLGYSFLVTWITSFVMVIVHERVPDMKRYPPLPDIFLDNVPHIPWAFNMCEITGTLLFTIWIVVIIFHKYRTVLLRRFFALAGTVFLLRCVTMLITSLSVPGTHLQCNQKDFAIEDADLDLIGSLWIRMRRAYTIWSGLGMSIQGVRTCGDYMFSGHTVALTLLNFFITEYTPRNLYFLHTLTWLLNMFGIFFILAAHEHYSIDVFVAFYITSRLFLYYHTLANNQALMQSDSTRTRIWFPMFSYFESSVEGIIPNEYVTPAALISSIIEMLLLLKDTLMGTAYSIWLDPPKMRKTSEHLLNGGRSSIIAENDVRQRNVATSVYFSVNSTPTASAVMQPVQKQQIKYDANIETTSNVIAATTRTTTTASSLTATDPASGIKYFAHAADDQATKLASDYCAHEDELSKKYV